MFQQWFNNTTTLLDLKAQWEMAEMARWMLWATVGSIIIGFLGFGALVYSLLQTQRSIKNSEVTAEDARSLGQATARAYLYVENLRLSDDNEAVIAKVRNTGSTPAPMLCAGCEVKVVPAGRMKKALEFGSYSYKGWHSLAGGTARDFRVEITNGVDLIRHNIARLDNGFGLMLDEVDGADKIVVIGRIVWNDVFGHYQETGFVFYTEDAARIRMKVPAGILPAFRLIDKAEVPPGMPSF